MVKSLIDLGAVQPTGDLSAVCYSSKLKDTPKMHPSYISAPRCLHLKRFSISLQVRRSIKFFLDNLLSQTPDQQQTLAAIGEV